MRARCDVATDEGASRPARARWDGDDGSLGPLLAQVERARHRGCTPIGLAADRPPSPAQLASAARAGVRELAIALHGARRQVHEWESREPGSFDAALAALVSARSLGMALAVTSALTRSTARVLPELPALLDAHGVALWVIDVANASERAPARLALALPPALAALDRAHRLGLKARIRGAPVCLLGPFARSALDAAPRAYGEPCVRCDSRRACPGVSAPYLDRFGAGELHPLASRPAAQPTLTIATLLA